MWGLIIIGTVAYFLIGGFLQHLGRERLKKL